MTELRFKSDTKHRNSWFTGISFSHPAKMVLPLQLWLYENYTKPGDVVLDPMAGSGTAVVGCSMGRHIICIELEPKFIEIIKGNWEKIQQRGPMLGCEMGRATILQGDARNLEGLLVDAVVTSPPYAEANKGGGIAQKGYEGKYGKDESLHLRHDRPLSNDPNNISNFPYGEVDSIITSPPYADTDVSQTHMTSKDRGNPDNPNYRPSWRQKLAEGYAESKRPYHQVDAIITSPPYEGSNQETSDKKRDWQIGNSFGRQLFEKINNPSNIGNLKST